MEHGASAWGVGRLVHGTGASQQPPIPNKTLKPVRNKATWRFRNTESEAEGPSH